MKVPIEDKTNKSKIGIVVIGYNRLHSISRLLISLLDASYPTNDIPLVISIDSSNDQALYDFVRNFKWPFGDKYVIIHEKRLGLKEHIFFGGDLTRYFHAIVLLEDDIYVSTDFYEYVSLCIEKYQTEERVAGISLYRNEFNGFVGIPFSPLNNGSDVFAAQHTSTWGECWTDTMWNGFRKWYVDAKVDFAALEMPEQIKRWKEAWSKYFNAYLITNDKYFIYPNISLSTNFSDQGVHGGTNNALVQVNLLTGSKKYTLYDFDELVRYDGFGNNMHLAEFMGLRKKDLCADLYGNHMNHSNKRYWLSILRLPYKISKSFALHMRPIELNIIRNLEGDGIYLYDTSVKKKVRKNNQIPTAFLVYYLQGYQRQDLLRSALRLYFEAFKRKSKLLFQLR